MDLIKLNRIERHRMTIFMICLTVAILTWIFIALSGRYVYRVESKINYIDPPESKAYHPLQEDSVSLQIEGTGWQLLFSRLRLQPQSVNVSLSALNSRNYIVFSGRLHELNKQFESNQRVISVNPDTLFFDFSKRSVKKVPVKVVYDIGFKKGFGISGPIKVSPESVVINGAAEDLKDIKEWPTTELIRTDVNSNIVARLGFISAKSNNMDIYPLSVRVEVPIDRFTEKVVEVPLTVLNKHGRNVKLLPDKVKITVLTALDNFRAAERDSFLVTVDLDHWLKDGYSQLPVTLKKLPRYSLLVKAEPQIVDFYIRK